MRTCKARSPDAEPGRRVTGAGPHTNTAGRQFVVPVTALVFVRNVGCKGACRAEETGQIKVGYRRTFPTRGDKAVRAQSIRGRMASQGLYVPTNEDWLPDFRTELLSFPAGKHDAS